jgi:hypothetical protein
LTAQITTKVGGAKRRFATVPLGAIQEMMVFFKRVSSEFGWTSGPALNIVTKSGTNEFHGEGIFMIRPGSLGNRTRFLNQGLLPIFRAQLRYADHT